MLAAMEPCTKMLSPEDSKRNVHRGHFMLRAKDRKRVDYPATFATLVSEEVDSEFFRTHIFQNPEQRFQDCYQIPRYVDPSFPSLYRIPFIHKIARVGVRVSLVPFPVPFGSSWLVCFYFLQQSYFSIFWGALLPNNVRNLVLIIQWEVKMSRWNLFEIISIRLQLFAWQISKVNGLYYL